MTPSALQFRRILVVEDEYILARGLQDWLEQLGATVVGPCPSVRAAATLIEAGEIFDVAIVDVNLGGAMAYPVADALRARNVPFVFTSGYEDGRIRGLYPGAQICGKPYDLGRLEALLASCLTEREAALQNGA